MNEKYYLKSQSKFFLQFFGHLTKDYFVFQDRQPKPKLILLEIVKLLI